MHEQQAGEVVLCDSSKDQSNAFQPRKRRNFEEAGNCLQEHPPMACKGNVGYATCVAQIISGSEMFIVLAMYIPPRKRAFVYHGASSRACPWLYVFVRSHPVCVYMYSLGASGQP